MEARLDDGDGELGVPLELPGLLEGAGRAAGVGELAPVDAEQRQPVQQDRPGQLSLTPQVELDDRPKSVGAHTTNVSPIACDCRTAKSSVVETDRRAAYRVCFYCGRECVKTAELFLRVRGCGNERGDCDHRRENPCRVRTPELHGHDRYR